MFRLIYFFILISSVCLMQACSGFKTALEKEQTEEVARIQKQFEELNYLHLAKLKSILNSSEVYKDIKNTDTFDIKIIFRLYVSKSNVRRNKYIHYALYKYFNIKKQVQYNFSLFTKDSNTTSYKSLNPEIDSIRPETILFYTKNHQLKYFAFYDDIGQLIFLC